MAKSFNITTTATDTLKADSNGHTEAVFTVTNTTARPVRGLARVIAVGDTKKEWLSTAGESDRDFAGGATEQFKVNFDAPGGVPTGKYSFRLDVAAATNPDEDSTAGPTVTVEVAGTAAVVQPPKAGFPKWIIFVIIGVVLVVGIVILVVVLMGGKSKEEAYVLPDVNNVAESTAKKSLESGCKKGAECVIVTVTPASDNTVAKGTAIGTLPVAGTAVTVGSNVTLITSSGAEPAVPYRLPAVANLTQEEAQSKLEGKEDECKENPCVQVVKEDGFDNKVPVGTVIRTQPKEGTNVIVGSTVTMVVSKGPDTVTIPPVEKLAADEATVKLETSCGSVDCLDVTINTVPDNTVANGNVIRTDPVAGTAVGFGSKVTMYVSGGRDEVMIPPVHRLSAADAKQKLERACKPFPCLKVVLTSKNDDHNSTGKAIGTTPAKGMVKIGSGIVLLVSTGPELITVPDYRGLHLSEAKKKIAKDGFTPRFVIHRFPVKFPATVATQRPAAGTKVVKGATISVGVVVGN